MITTPSKKLICKFRTSALIGFLSLTFLSSSYSQDNVKGNTQQAAEAASTSVEEQFTLNMREADIQGFIQWVANRTGKNIVIHRSVRGAITILSSRAVSPDEAYELFLTVLSMNGFAAVETDGIIKVIPDTETKTNAIPFLGEQARNGSVVISIIDIKNSSSSDLMALARPLMPASAHIASYNQSNTLII
ncbi:MAG: hypothetical protein ACPG3T_07505, partial [Pseudomonadales bacterium]